MLLLLLCCRCRARWALCLPLVEDRSVWCRRQAGPARVGGSRAGRRGSRFHRVLALPRRCRKSLPRRSGRLHIERWGRMLRSRPCRLFVRLLGRAADEEIRVWRSLTLLRWCMQMRRAVRVALRVALLLFWPTAPTVVIVVVATATDIVHVRIVVPFHGRLIAVREAELGPHVHSSLWRWLLVLLMPGAGGCSRRGERRRLRRGELGKRRR